MSPRQWTPFLRAHGYVAQERLNVELAEAFAELGTILDFKKYIKIPIYQAPEGSEENFLTYCGILGYGKYLSKYFDQKLFLQLREKASDPRKSIREATIKSFRYIAEKRLSTLFNNITKWNDASSVELQVLLSAFCTKKFLTNTHTSSTVFDFMDWVMICMLIEQEDWNWEYAKLQEELERSLHMALNNNPEKSKPFIERWLKEDYPFINTVLVKSLTHSQLQSIDSIWIEQCVTTLENK